MPLPAFQIRFASRVAILAAAGLVGIASPAWTTSQQQDTSVRRDSSANQAPDKETSASSAAAPKPKPPKPAWPVKGPSPLPGSILPNKRIVAYYGNPLSRRMGILGELPPDEMLKRLEKEVKAWERADSTMPVQPALHLITVVAQGSPGRDGMYRARMSDSLIERVYGWAQKHKAIVFLDL